MLARKLILGFGFAVLIPLLIHCGIEAFVPPNSNQEYYQEVSHLRDAERDATGNEKARLRSQREQLEARHTAQSNQTERVHFFVGAPLGILVTLLGSFIRAQAIGGGLMLGGICTFTGGCAYYWADLSRPGRFLVLLVAFAVLLWIGYQRLSELKQPAKAA